MMSAAYNIKFYKQESIPIESISKGVSSFYTCLTHYQTTPGQQFKHLLQ